MPSAADSPALRKARGAFFTPAAITSFISGWALRASTDRVFEPAAGDAAFLVAAVERLQALAASPDAAAACPRTLLPSGAAGTTAQDSSALTAAFVPQVEGVEIHPESAAVGRTRVQAAGGRAAITVADFFDVTPQPVYDAVIGNPPFIRYQGFTGAARARAREAALRGGVSLSGLASSWAAFVVHAALFLKPGGRLGLVLPAELLTVNYAAPVRTFLFERFGDVQLVLFEEQVFDGAEADVVLLLAEGYEQGPAGHATIRQARDAAALTGLAPGLPWAPADPAGKWIDSIVDPAALSAVDALSSAGAFSQLEVWGDTTLGMVTGANTYFALTRTKAAELGLTRRDLVRLSPPGSAHLRGLDLTARQLSRLDAAGRATVLFRPREPLSPAAAAYVAAGEQTGVDTAYKCRVRRPWYRVPLLAPADLLLTCMNADTPRLTTNSARAHHLNSVHGVYLRDEHAELGRALLPLAALNSVTMLSAELVGRSYGGGILKLEPREADRWAVPAPQLVAAHAEQLQAIRPRVARLLAAGRVAEAAAAVDAVLLTGSGLLGDAELTAVRTARTQLAERRRVRGSSGR